MSKYLNIATIDFYNYMADFDKELFKDYEKDILNGEGAKELLKFVFEYVDRFKNYFEEDMLNAILGVELVKNDTQKSTFWDLINRDIPESIISKFLETIASQDEVFIFFQLSDSVDIDSSLLDFTGDYELSFGAYFQSDDGEWITQIYDYGEYDTGFMEYGYDGDYYEEAIIKNRGKLPVTTAKEITKSLLKE